MAVWLLQTSDGQPWVWNCFIQIFILKKLEIQNEWWIEMSEIVSKCRTIDSIYRINGVVGSTGSSTSVTSRCHQVPKGHCTYIFTATTECRTTLCYSNEPCRSTLPHISLSFPTIVPPILSLGDPYVSNLCRRLRSDGSTRELQDFTNRLTDSSKAHRIV